MTPRLESLKFSKCGNLFGVSRKGYKYKGMLAADKKM
jgi:hypothetical protein